MSKFDNKVSNKFYNVENIDKIFEITQQKKKQMTHNSSCQFTYNFYYKLKIYLIN